MQIKEYTTYNHEEIIALYDSVKWTAYTDNPDTLRKGIKNSLLTLAACEDDKLIGLIRTVGDGYTVVLIQDIIVHPEYQRQGIGSQLIKAVLSRFSHVRQIQLVTDNTPKTTGFYKSRGFADIDDIGCCGFMKI